MENPVIESRMPRQVNYSRHRRRLLCCENRPGKFRAKIDMHCEGGLAMDCASEPYKIPYPQSPSQVVIRAKCHNDMT